MRTDGGVGQRAEHVEHGQRPRGVLHARRLGGDRRAQRLEDLELALEDALVGAQHLLLVLLQRRRDEALAAGHGLLAVVVRRDVVQVRLGDLDVVAEHAVEADLQRVDAGARALALFHLGDHLLARSADVPQVVELRVDAVANHAAVAGQRARLVDQRRARWPSAAPARRRATPTRLRHQRRLQAVEHHPHAWDRAERLLQPDKVARSGHAQRGPRHEPLEVVHRLERIAQLRALHAAKGQFLDGIETIANRFERNQRANQPRAEQPAAHRRDGLVDLVEQRPDAPAVAALQDLEVLQRDRVDQQVPGLLAEADRADVGEVRLLAVPQVRDQRTGRGDRRIVAVQAEAFEAARPELFDQRAPRAVAIELPGLDPRQRHADARRLGQSRQVGAFGDHQLARPKHAQLVFERLPASGARVLGRAELAGRQVDQRDAELVAAIRRDAHEKRRLARLEVVGVEQRARERPRGRPRA